MISPYDDAAALLHQLYTVVGLCAIADDVPQAIDGVDVQCVDDFKDPLEGGEVSMDVRDYSYAHWSRQFIRNNIRNDQVKIQGRDLRLAMYEKFVRWFTGYERVPQRR